MRPRLTSPTLSPARRSPPVSALAAAIGLALAATPALAQLTEYKLNPDGTWQQTQAPQSGTDEAIMNDARGLVAADRPAEARRMMDAWISAAEGTDNAWMSEALLIRGDALTLEEDEFEALYDYERVIKEFPGSSAYGSAIDRELQTAIRYVNGYYRKWWFGLRWEDASRIGEEILIRVCERLPGSRVAERAMIELADYYYRERELKAAAETYDIFLVNFPVSEYRRHAMQRSVYSNIGRFKGPEYDSSGLSEAKELIDRYAGKFPAEADSAGLNEALLARLDESAAISMLQSAEWYLKRGDPTSAKLVLNRLLRKHPATAAAERGLAIMEKRGWVKPLAAPAPDAGAAPTETAPSATPAPSDAPAAPSPAPREGQR
jgi:tetratricopeptide (TPR) repeat protein